MKAKKVLLPFFQLAQTRPYYRGQQSRSRECKQADRNDSLFRIITAANKSSLSTRHTRSSTDNVGPLTTTRIAGRPLAPFYLIIRRSLLDDLSSVLSCWKVALPKNRGPNLMSLKSRILVSQPNNDCKSQQYHAMPFRYFANLSNHTCRLWGLIWLGKKHPIISKNVL